jgi:hypothetical protein
MEKSINSVFYCKKCNQSYPIKSKQYHDSFCNPNTKFCPYCHLEIDSIEYNDHIFCHKLDNENNISSFHLNNNNVINNNKDLEIKRINSKIVKIGNTEFYDCEDELKEIRRLEEEKKIYNEKILGLKGKKETMITKIKNFFSNNGTDIAIVTFSLIGCVFLIPECYYILTGKIIEAFQNSSNDEKGEKKEKMKPDEIMKYLPVTKLGKKINNNNDIEYKCIICYEDFNEGDDITTLPCAHVFHIKCIKTWIYEHGNCPICKFIITKKSLLGEL